MLSRRISSVALLVQEISSTEWQELKREFFHLKNTLPELMEIKKKETKREKRHTQKKHAYIVQIDKYKDKHTRSYYNNTVT